VLSNYQCDNCSIFFLSCVINTLFLKSFSPKLCLRTYSYSVLMFCSIIGHFCSTLEQLV
jgi:hypothetical protein